MLGLKVGHSRKYFSQLFYYTPPKTDMTPPSRKMYLLLEKVIFQLAMVSFLKSNCNNYAQLKRHYGTALCRSSTTKTNNFTYLGLPATLRCQPPKLAEKKHGRKTPGINILARKEFHDQTCWILIHFRDLAFSISKWQTDQHEPSYPAPLGKGKPSNSITGAFLKSAVYIFSAFISQ